MNRKQNRSQPRPAHASDAAPAIPDIRQVMPDINRVMRLDASELAARGDGELAGSRLNAEDSEILLTACRIVISGYKAEISRGQHDSLFVQAAYQLLHRFLERQFERNSRAA
jgi:hypothetical protein